MLIPCDCAKLLQHSVRGSKMVAEKLWCRVYGTVWQTLLIPALHIAFLLSKWCIHIIVKEAGKQDDVSLEVAYSQDGNHQVIWQMEMIFWQLLLVVSHKRINTTNHTGFDFYDLELLT